MAHVKKPKTLERKAYVKTGAMRLFFIVAAISIQIAWLYLVMDQMSSRYPLGSALISASAVIISLMIYGRHENAAMKMMWMLLIIAFPPLGTLMYLLTGLTGTTRAMKRRFRAVNSRLAPFLLDDGEQYKAIRAQDSVIAGECHYIRERSGFPVYDNTDIEFFPDTVDILKQMQEDLRHAEHFIFMEYYAIEDESAFSSIHSILVERAKAGVEVRLFYDDIGSIFFINHDFVHKMEDDGIKCRIFNPMLPLTNIFMHNRDHRKITVIDGKIAYTGGYNLADEYFNITSPYGVWKDSGIRMEGGAVRSMTYMFLEMWNAIRLSSFEDRDFKPYFLPLPPRREQSGFVQPYGDSPLIFENIAENVYINILSGAKDYCWFTTPYLIITDEMVRAFLLAAGRGVDVRIITPGIPDKKFTYKITRSSYRILASNGVRIFEFTPGFCHSKQCVSDDKVAICGTINLDYRSLYHHFENGVLIYDSPAVEEIKADFDALFPQCQEVTEQYTKHVPFIVRFWETVIRTVAPLV